MKAKNWIKKSVFILIVLSLVFSLPCYGLAAGSLLTGAERMANCNEIVFSFWDKYTDYDEDLYLPPDYFGGFSRSEDNNLIMYITEDTAEIRKQAKADCDGADFSFVEVEHSFNQLNEAMLSLDRFSKRLEAFTCGAYIDIPKNKVAVLLIPDFEGFKKEWASIVADNEDIDPDLYTFEIKKEPPAIDDSAKSQIDNAPTSLTPNTTYAFYPGIQSSFGNSYGTISFCAYDSLGRYLLITHAHNLGFTSTISPRTVTVAGLNMDAYTLSPTATNAPAVYYDAAYIVIPSTASYTVSNKVNNTTTRISYVALDSQLSSYSGGNVSAYGVYSGFKSSTVTVVYSSGFYTLQVNTTFGSGDSGGPIYLTGNSQNRLIGIIITQQGVGNTWMNIRDRYYTATGQTLSPYLYNY